MSYALSEDQIKKRCRELVYQVAYSFYDPPYIIMLHLLLHYEVYASHPTPC
jgi:transcription initiation factor TFIIE subunit alpha